MRNMFRRNKWREVHNIQPILVDGNQGDELELTYTDGLGNVIQRRIKPTETLTVNRVVVGRVENELDLKEGYFIAAGEAK